MGWLRTLRMCGGAGGGFVVRVVAETGPSLDGDPLTGE